MSNIPNQTRRGAGPAEPQLHSTADIDALIADAAAQVILGEPDDDLVIDCGNGEHVTLGELLAGLADPPEEG